MEKYIKLNDVFDETPLFKVGDWSMAWGEYRGIYYKLRGEKREGNLADGINNLTLIQLKGIHNCMIADNDLRLLYRDLTFTLKAQRNQVTLEIFNAIIDRIEAISNNVVHIHS